MPGFGNRDEGFGVSQLAADIVVLVHVGFVLFVVLGGLLVLRWRRLAWLHVPAVVWGVTIEWAGWICPLTPLEHSLRRRGGATGYRGDFIEHYLLPLLYPAQLTREWQTMLGGAALAVNVFVYWWIVRDARAKAL
jgi:hypothetical protein